MGIEQTIKIKPGEKVYNYCLCPCHIHTLRMVLSSAKKNDWGTEENNNLVNELSEMFDSLSDQLNSDRG